MKLIQIPTVNLDERIKEEMEENPALETADETHDEHNTEMVDEFESNDDNDDEFEKEESDDDYDNIDVAEYVSDDDDDIADYKLKDDNYPEMDDKKTIPFKIESTFHEYLLDQLTMLTLDEKQRKIAEQIVGSIDDDGYLRRDYGAISDDLAFRQNIDASEEDIAAIVKQIQQFDPPGICAKDLRECLLLQLKRKHEEEGDEVAMTINILTNYFDEFTKKHYDKIQRGLNLTDADLKAAIHQIIRLNPKPGGNIGGINKMESYIIPDFFIHNNNNVLELTLNSKNAPDLRINEGYKNMLRDYDKGSKKDKRQKEAVLFIKQKIDAAKWFIEAIKQRQDTLYTTMHAIMEYQHDFFLTGDETTLKPMILKDVAELTGLDISTISRVANSKFVQTEFGTYRLKFFFSESISTESGEEVSTREVKKILSDVVAEESKKKPLNDGRLTFLLQQKGYNIARRTVAKYREQLNIPVARLRKQL